jgi:hypothetical protein
MRLPKLFKNKYYLGVLFIIGAFFVYFIFRQVGYRIETLTQSENNTALSENNTASVNPVSIPNSATSTEAKKIKAVEDKINNITIKINDMNNKIK